MRRAPYELRLEARDPDGSRIYRFETADGVASKRSVRASELLLANELADRDLGRLLCPRANYGVVGTLLADRASTALLTETSARAATLCRRNAAENGADVAVSLVADLATVDRSFDVVAYAPRAYAPVPIVSQYVADALALLDPGGRLFLAATERAGLARYEAVLADLTGAVDRVGASGDCRLLRARRPPEFDPPSYVTPRRLSPSIGGVDLSLRSIPGLFAASGLDDGTRLLLETVGDDLAAGERVLDLCCGYAPIGAYAAAVGCEVDLTDDCRLATRCAERSLRATGVEGAVHTADCLEGVADRTFDVVLSNPPTHAGDDVLSELCAGAAAVLAPGGRFSLVFHRELDLRDHLAAFDRVERRRTGAEHVVATAYP